MQVFFICCGIFLIAAWIILSTEHGEKVGKSILETVKKIFGGKK